MNNTLKIILIISCGLFDACGTPKKWQTGTQTGTDYPPFWEEEEESSTDHASSSVSESISNHFEPTSPFLAPVPVDTFAHTSPRSNGFAAAYAAKREAAQAKSVTPAAQSSVDTSANPDSMILLQARDPRIVSRYGFAAAYAAQNRALNPQVSGLSFYGSSLEINYDDQFRRLNNFYRERQKTPFTLIEFLQQMKYYHNNDITSELLDKLCQKNMGGDFKAICQDFYQLYKNSIDPEYKSICYKLFGCFVNICINFMKREFGIAFKSDIFLKLEKQLESILEDSLIDVKLKDYKTKLENWMQVFRNKQEAFACRPGVYFPIIDSLREDSISNNVPRLDVTLNPAYACYLMLARGDKNPILDKIVVNSGRGVARQEKEIKNYQDLNTALILLFRHQ